MFQAANDAFPLNNQCNGTMIAAAVNMGVDYWCGGTEGGCCGLCYNTSVSGYGQFIWAILETVLTMGAVLINPGEAWKACIVQLLVTDSFIICTFARIKLGASAGSTSKWQAEFVIPQALNFIPIMVSLIMSPVWSLIGAERDVITRTHEEMARDQARLEHPDVPEHEKADLRGKNLQHYLEGIRKGRTSTALSTKAASYGRWGKWMICIWFVHLILWGAGTWYYIYAGNFEFWQANCEAFVAQEIKGTLTPLIASLILGTMACLVFILMLFVFWTGRGGVDLIFGHRKDGKGYGPSNYRSDFPLILHDRRQMILHWTVTFAFFAIWLGLNSFLYFYALDKFLLLGSDPWTYGQIEQVIFALPSAYGFVNAVRSRIDANAKDAAENHEAHNTRRVAAGEAPVAYDPQYARHARHDVRDKYKTSAAIEKHTEDVTARQDHLADWAKAGSRTRVKLLPAHAKHKALEKLRPGYYKLPVKSSGVIEAPRPTRHHEHEAPPVGEDEVEYARQQKARRLWVPRKTAGVVHGEEEGAGGDRKSVV